MLTIRWSVGLASGLVPTPMFERTAPGRSADWQRTAGLNPRKPVRIFPGQGPVLQIGERPVA